MASLKALSFVSRLSIVTDMLLFLMKLAIEGSFPYSTVGDVIPVKLNFDKIEFLSDDSIVKCLGFIVYIWGS